MVTGYGKLHNVSLGSWFVGIFELILNLNTLQSIYMNQIRLKLRILIQRVIAIQMIADRFN